MEKKKINENKGEKKACRESYLIMPTDGKKIPLKECGKNAKFKDSAKKLFIG